MNTMWTAYITWAAYGLCLTAAASGVLLFCTARPAQPGLFRKKRRRLTKEEMKTLLKREWKRAVSRTQLDRMAKEQRKNRAEGEIAEAISYLRNAVAMGRGETMGTGLILEELSELQGSLSPAYLKMIQYLRLNEKEKVIETFYQACGSELSRDFARLLLQWEELPPVLLVETLESYQKNIREVRLTKQKKRDELISDFIYLPVIMNVMLVLVNFIYVAYFIDQREMLLTMFG